MPDRNLRQVWQGDVDRVRQPRRAGDGQRAPWPSLHLWARRWPRKRGDAWTRAARKVAQPRFWQVKRLSGTREGASALPSGLCCIIDAFNATLSACAKVRRVPIHP